LIIQPFYGAVNKMTDIGKRSIRVAGDTVKPGISSQILMAVITLSHNAPMGAVVLAKALGIARAVAGSAVPKRLTLDPGAVMAFIAISKPVGMLLVMEYHG
jgi:hypothetical protein